MYDRFSVESEIAELAALPLPLLNIFGRIVAHHTWAGADRRGTNGVAVAVHADAAILKRSL